MNHKRTFLTCLALIALGLAACSDDLGIAPQGAPDDAFPFEPEYRWSYRCTATGEFGTTVRTYIAKIASEESHGIGYGNIMYRENIPSAQWKKGFALVDSAGAVYTTWTRGIHKVRLFYHSYEGRSYPRDTVQLNGQSLTAYRSTLNMKVANSVSNIYASVAPGFGIVKETGNHGGSLLIGDYYDSSGVDLTIELVAMWKEFE